MISLDRAVLDCACGCGAQGVGGLRCHRALVDVPVRAVLLCLGQKAVLIKSLSIKARTNEALSSKIWGAHRSCFEQELPRVKISRYASAAADQSLPVAPVDATAVRCPPSRPVGGVSHEPAGVPTAACQSLLQERTRSAAYARRSVHVAAASFSPRVSPGRTLAGGLASSR